MCLSFYRVETMERKQSLYLILRTTFTQSSSTTTTQTQTFHSCNPEAPQTFMDCRKGFCSSVFRLKNQLLVSSVVKVSEISTKHDYIKYDKIKHDKFKPDQIKTSILCTITLQKIEFNMYPICLKRSIIIFSGIHSRYWMVGCLDPRLTFGSMNYLVNGAPSESDIARNCLETLR